MINLQHKKLEVWKKSIVLTSNIYEITRSFPKSEQYGLSSQMRRAAVSIASNIAEGAARKSAKERRRFYEIARSSLVEIDTQLEVSRKLSFVPDDKLSDFDDRMNHVFAMLSNMIKKTR
ncbi:MAG: four helix bundle protein [Balneolaceae bacterium]|nr:four helix bundle protein [Balneolaceae bacterium]